MIQVDTSKQVTNSLKITPNPTIDNGLCRMQLVNVEIKDKVYGTTNKNGTVSQADFAGFTVPTISFAFESVRLSITEPVRHFWFAIEPTSIGTKLGTTFEKNGKTVTIDEKFINGVYTGMWNHLAHIADAFVGTKNWNKELRSFIDTGINKIKADGTLEEVLNTTKKYFEKIVELFNSKEGKLSVYKVDDKYFPLIAKLVYTKSDNSMQLSFPAYVGEGYIQALKLKTVGGKPVLDTTLEVKPNEVITNKVVAKPDASLPNNPTFGQGLSPDQMAALGMTDSPF